MSRRIEAEILVIGKEILAGLREDANTKSLAGWLAPRGIDIRRVVMVGDRDGDILEALRAARARLVLVTGGLGSTRDDRTRLNLARFLGCPLARDPSARERLVGKLRHRGIRFTRRYEVFALFPRGAKPLENPAGLAEGLLAERLRRVYVALPGVPSELQAILGDSLEPELIARGLCASGDGRVVVGVAGLREPVIEDLFLDLPSFRRGLVSILPSPGIVQLVLPDRGLLRTVRARLGRHVFTVTGEKLEEAVLAALAARGESVSVAESCTGGMVGSVLTSVPGSSATFRGAIVAYDNDAKQRLLDVSARLLRTHGAVSRETALSMARGVRRALRSVWGVSVTGIAGPGGAVPGKPVGTVHVAVSGPGVEAAEVHLFRGRRETVRIASCRAALDLLRRSLPPLQKKKIR